MDMEASENEPVPMRQPRPVRGSTTILVIVLSMIALVATGALLYTRESAQVVKKEDAATALAVYGEVPPVTLTERSGRQVSLGELRGKIWVANFIFTSCSGTCQLMSSKLKDLQASLRKAGDVSLVSISVDPKNDTPERLTEFATRYGADPERWLFLTGPDSTVQSLAKNSFLLTVQEGTSAEEPIIHSTRFVLVDREGKIRGYYDSMQNESHPKLMTDIGLLLRDSQ